MNENDKDIFSEENPPEKDGSQNAESTADGQETATPQSDVQKDSPNNEEADTQAFS